MGQLDIYRCEDCGFVFEQDYLNFYLNLESGQIEEYMLLFSTANLDRNSPITGDVYKTYCGKCNKLIKTYHISSCDKQYDFEAAYYLLRLLIPKKIDFLNEKIGNYEYLGERIKNNDFDYLKDFIEENNIYFDELYYIEDKKDVRDIDIEDHINSSKEELDLLKNTVFSINLGDETYNINLNGEKLAKDICPNCKSVVNEINGLNPCPKCGGKIYPFESIMMD